MMELIEFIKQPWSWYASGIAIAVVMLTLLYFGKTFSMSSNFRIICSACGAGKYVKFFDYDWKSHRWNLLFTLGAITGGFFAYHFLNTGEPVKISMATVTDLNNLGFKSPHGLQPDELFGRSQFSNLKTMIFLIIGGLLVGFGTRWAGGCTSGHAISGLSNLQLPSLISAIGFFIGGLVMTHLIFPLIF